MIPLGSLTADQEFVNGTFKTGSDRVFDLKNDGVGYSTSGGLVDDIKTQLDALKADIISGKIVVPTTLSG